MAGADYIEAYLYSFLMGTAAIGGGSLLLRIFGISRTLSWTSETAIALPLGAGLIGWLIFYFALLGLIGKAELTVLFLLLSIGVFSLRLERKSKLSPTSNLFENRLSFWSWLLFAGILTVMTFDFFEALAPPADGDSSAYHFALPKAFLHAGGLKPLFHAVEGSIPLLQQMTYLGALGTGGERTLTLWTMLSGWAAAGMVFVVSRRYLPRDWALSAALIWLTTPAVIYGAGSGQVEVRNAAFVLVSLLCAAEARQRKDWRFALLAGIAAGFFMASKYTGLIFVFSCGVVILAQKQWFKQAAVYTIGVLFVGSQWYFWNAWLTGDPVFPLLYGIVDYLPNVPWNPEINVAHQRNILEKAVPQNLFWFFAYPVKATIFADPAFESLRVGFGPLVLMLLPLTIIGLWAGKNGIFSHPLLVFAGACFIAYAVWFFAGSSQRVRHLLPLYPILLICVLTAAWRAAEAKPRLLSVFVGVCVLVIPMQISGMAFFSINFIKFALNDETKDEFLRRNLSEYEAVAVSKKYLRPEDRLLVTNRQLIYHFSVPVMYAHPLEQAVVELHPWADDPERFWRQLRKQRITHMLLTFLLENNGLETPLARFASALDRQNCIAPIVDGTAIFFASRTIPALIRSESPFNLVRLTPDKCAYE